MTKAEEIGVALAEASVCRQKAAMLRQMKFAPDYARHLLDNAKAAERWAVKRAKDDPA